VVAPQHGETEASVSAVRQWQSPYIGILSRARSRQAAAGDNRGEPRLPARGAGEGIDMPGLPVVSLKLHSDRSKIRALRKALATTRWPRPPHAWCAAKDNDVALAPWQRLPSVATFHDNYREGGKDAVLFNS
jgi:hypothetical protein